MYGDKKSVIFSFYSLAGKYPPAVIIENPANLHSETVTSELAAEVDYTTKGLFVILFIYDH